VKVIVKVIVRCVTQSVAYMGDLVVRILHDGTGDDIGRIPQLDNALS